MEPHEVRDALGYRGNFGCEEPVNELPSGDREKNHQREDQLKPCFESKPFEVALGEAGLPIGVFILEGSQGGRGISLEVSD